MKVELEKAPENVVNLKIELPAKEGVDAYNRAVDGFSRNLSIPGFRKGKAPRSIVENNVGKERIKYEALERLLPSVMTKAIEDNNLDVITQPSIKNYKFELGEDLEIQASVEIRPEVELGQYKGLTLEVEKYELPEDAFEKSLNNMLEQYSTLEQVTNRNSKSDDVIVFDFDGYVDGEKIPHGEAKKYTMDLAHSTFIPGFAEQLVDKALDTDFDVNVKFPEEYHEKSIAGKDAVFKCRIHEIKTRVIPELTDEFAQKVGPFKTVDELKTNIQEYLDKQVEEQNDRRARNAIFDKVIETSKADIQKSMIEREKNSLLEEYKQKLASQGFTWENAVEAQGIENILKNIQEDAQARIMNSLVINKVAKEAEIKIEAGDFQKKLDLLKMSYQLDEKTLLSELSANPMLINQMTQQAVNEKVIDFLVENNTINFVNAKK